MRFNALNDANFSFITEVCIISAILVVLNFVPKATSRMTSQDIMHPMTWEPDFTKTF
jgi:hypothetical protein